LLLESPSLAQQIGVLFQCDHLAAQPRQHGGRIAGGAADIENAVVRLDRGQLQQLGETARFQHEAARRHLHGHVGIGQSARRPGHIALPCHRLKGRQDLRIGDVAGPDLAVDHMKPRRVEHQSTCKKRKESRSAYTAAAPRLTTRPVATAL